MDLVRTLCFRNLCSLLYVSLRIWYSVVDEKCRDFERQYKFKKHADYLWNIKFIEYLYNLHME